MVADQSFARRDSLKNVVEAGDRASDCNDQFHIGFVACLMDKGRDKSMVKRIGHVGCRGICRAMHAVISRS
jgi:hypothetical protein